jgi:hypothetical protein
MSRTLKSGSSYLSQSEPTLTFGMGREERAGRVVVHWPSGRTDEHRAMLAGRTWLAIEGRKPVLL